MAGVRVISKVSVDKNFYSKNNYYLQQFFSHITHWMSDYFHLKFCKPWLSCTPMTLITFSYLISLFWSTLYKYIHELNFQEATIIEQCFHYSWHDTAHFWDIVECWKFQITSAAAVPWEKFNTLAASEHLLKN